ncbi:TetR/AcrR family transcriptional regulator [Nocardioides gilvus]|uniref:TetR/AcrR family transcriptional regulator n=1 Tax=Nocardioides gilvus TaxID=1735589 RepID=UPI000D74A8C3|nr:TetR family transcriptional regulator C-terminal domain-containing protein [Nocardioides gilvus]
MARMSQVDRRLQLVEAAIVVMTRDGVRSATTRAIAGEAGASLSVFHYCFDSKSALLGEVVTTLVERTAAGSRDALAAVEPDGDPVRASLMAFWGHVTSHPDEHQLTYEITQHCLRDPELAEVTREQYERYVEVIAEHLALGLPTAASTEQVRLLARYLAVMIDGLTLDWLVRRDDAGALAVLETVITHVNHLLSETVV